MRSKKLILLSHCILNVNSKALGIERHEALYENILKELIKKKVGLIQLSCPELFYGIDREPQNREFFENLEYRRYCKGLAGNVLKILKLYREKRHEVLGLVTVGGPPSCGFERTRKTLAGKTRMGVFVEELSRLCERDEVELEMLDEDSKKFRDFLRCL